MENAFDLAYDAYRQRKYAERQLHWQQLRADLAAPAPSVRATAPPTPRSRQARHNAA